MGNSKSKRLTCGVNLVDSLNKGDRAKQMREIKKRIEQFDTKQLKKDFIEWMEEKTEQEVAGSIIYLKTKKFNSIFLKLLKSLDSELYGMIVSSLIWCLSTNFIDLQNPSIQKHLLQIYLKTVFDEPDKEVSSSQISMFREFIDCWISADSIEILNHIVYFLMDLDDPATFDLRKVYQPKKVSKLQTDTQDALANVLHGREVYTIKYLPESKFNLNTRMGVEQAEKLNFFLTQIIEMSKTITNFLFELFVYIFNFIELPQNEGDTDSLKEIITRYLFSKDSNLLALCLYLCRVLNSKEHSCFTDKKEWLATLSDEAILSVDILMKLRQKARSSSTLKLEFRSDLSKTCRTLEKTLVVKLSQPVTSYDDIIDRLKDLSATLSKLSDKDHYFLVYWVDICQSWIFTVFGKDLEVDTKVMLINVIIKYLDSNEALVFAIVIQRLHKERLEDHRLFKLFIDTMKTERNDGQVWSAINKREMSTIPLRSQSRRESKLTKKPSMEDFECDSQLGQAFGTLEEETSEQSTLAKNFQAEPIKPKKIEEMDDKNNSSTPEPPYKEQSTGDLTNEDIHVY
jgi:hypothetical protein